LGWLALFIANNKALATSALPTRIFRIDPTRENTRIAGFVLAIGEDTPFHPEGPFLIASFAVLA
jgi:hypothetical protein